MEKEAYRITFNTKVGTIAAKSQPLLGSLQDVLEELRDDVQPLMEDMAPNLEPTCIHLEEAIRSLSGMLKEPNPVNSTEPVLDIDSREVVKDKLLPLYDSVDDLVFQLRFNIQPELNGFHWKTEKCCVLAEALQREFVRLLGIPEPARLPISAKIIDAEWETFPYGVAVNRVSGAAFAFNRDYFVLPGSPDPAVVKDYKDNSTDYSLGSAKGRGRYKPEIRDESQWDTYWIHPGKYPRFKNTFYDRSIYE
jgi:hypothetical protein